MYRRMLSMGSALAALAMVSAPQPSPLMSLSTGITTKATSRKHHKAGKQDAMDYANRRQFHPARVTTLKKLSKLRRIDAG